MKGDEYEMMWHIEVTVTNIDENVMVMNIDENVMVMNIDENVMHKKKHKQKKIGCNGRLN